MPGGELFFTLSRSGPDDRYVTARHTKGDFEIAVYEEWVEQTTDDKHRVRVLYYYPAFRHKGWTKWICLDTRTCAHRRAEALTWAELLVKCYDIYQDVAKLMGREMSEKEFIVWAEAYKQSMTEQEDRHDDAGR